MASNEIVKLYPLSISFIMQAQMPPWALRSVLRSGAHGITSYHWDDRCKMICPLRNCYLLFNMHGSIFNKHLILDKISKFEYILHIMQ